MTSKLRAEFATFGILQLKRFRKREDKELTIIEVNCYSDGAIASKQGGRQAKKQRGRWAARGVS